MSQSTNYERNPAIRVFAQEYRDATLEERKGDGDRDPKYVLLPTGEWANRVFIVGTLAEAVVGEEGDYVHGSVRDPTGRFTISAGEYQPKAVEKLKRIETPEMVALTGKTRLYQGDNGQMSKVNVTNITPIPEALYDRWVADTARQTMLRLKAFGDDDNVAAKRAAEEYGTSLGQYRDAAIEGLDRVEELILEDQPEAGQDAQVAESD